MTTADTAPTVNHLTHRGVLLLSTIDAGTGRELLRHGTLLRCTECDARGARWAWLDTNGDLEEALCEPCARMSGRES